MLYWRVGIEGTEPQALEDHADTPVLGALLGDLRDGAHFARAECLWQVTDARASWGEHHATAVGLLQAGQAAQQGGLATAVGADEPQTFTLVEDEAHAIQNGRDAKRFFEVLDLKHGVSCESIELRRHLSNCERTSAG